MLTRNMHFCIRSLKPHWFGNVCFLILNVDKCTMASSSPSSSTAFISRHAATTVEEDQQHTAMKFLLDELTRELLHTLGDDKRRGIAGGGPPLSASFQSDSDVTAARRHILDKTSLFFLSKTCLAFVSTSDAHPSCALIISTLLDFSVRGMVGAKEGGSLQRGDLLVLQEARHQQRTAGNYVVALPKSLRRRALEVAGDVMASIGPTNAQLCFPGVSSFVAKQLSGVAASTTSGAAPQQATTAAPPPMLLRSQQHIRTVLRRSEECILTTNPSSNCLSRTEAYLREIQAALGESLSTQRGADSAKRDPVGGELQSYPPSHHFTVHPSSTDIPLELYNDLRLVMVLAVNLFSRGLLACLHPSCKTRSTWLQAVLPHLKQHLMLVLSEEVVFLSQHFTTDDDRCAGLMGRLHGGARCIQRMLAGNNHEGTVGEDGEAEVRKLAAAMDSVQADLVASYSDRTDILTQAVNIATTALAPTTSGDDRDLADQGSHFSGAYGEFGFSASRTVAQLIMTLVDCGAAVPSSSAGVNALAAPVPVALPDLLAKLTAQVVYEDVNRFLAGRRNSLCTAPATLRWLIKRVGDDDALIDPLLESLSCRLLPQLVSALRGVCEGQWVDAIAEDALRHNDQLTLHSVVLWNNISTARSVLPVVGTYLLPVTFLLLVRVWVPQEQARQQKWLRYEQSFRLKNNNMQPPNTYTSLSLLSTSLPFSTLLGSSDERDELDRAMALSDQTVLDDLVDEVCEGTVQNLSTYLTLLTPSQVGGGEGCDIGSHSFRDPSSAALIGRSGEVSTGLDEVDSMLQVVRTALTSNSGRGRVALEDSPVLSVEYAPARTVHTLGTNRLLDGYMLLFNVVSPPQLQKPAPTHVSPPVAPTRPSLLETHMMRIVDECLQGHDEAFATHIGLLRLHFYAHFLNARMSHPGALQQPTFGTGAFVRPGPGGYSLQAVSHYFTQHGRDLLVDKLAAKPPTPSSTSSVPPSLASAISVAAAAWLEARAMTHSMVGGGVVFGGPPSFDTMIVPILSREEFTRPDVAFGPSFASRVEREFDVSGVDTVADAAVATPPNGCANSADVAHLVKSKRLFRCVLLGREIIGMGSGLHDEYLSWGEGLLCCMAQSLLSEASAVLAVAQYAATEASIQHSNDHRETPNTAGALAVVRRLLGETLPEVQRAGKRFLVVTMFPVMRMAAPLPGTSSSLSPAQQQLTFAGAQYYEKYVRRAAVGIMMQYIRPLSLLSNRKVPLDVAMVGLANNLRSIAPPNATISPATDNGKNDMVAVASPQAAGRDGQWALATAQTADAAFLQIILAGTAFAPNRTGSSNDSATFVLSQRELLVDECYKMLRTRRADQRAAAFMVLSTAIDQLTAAAAPRSADRRQGNAVVCTDEGNDGETGDVLQSGGEPPSTSRHFDAISTGSICSLVSVPLAFTRPFSCPPDENVRAEVERGIACDEHRLRASLIPHIANHTTESAAFLSKVIDIIEEGLGDVSSLVGPTLGDSQSSWAEPALLCCTKTLALCSVAVREVYWWRRQIKCELRRVVGTSSTHASDFSMGIDSCTCLGVLPSTYSCDDEACVTEDDSDGEDDYCLNPPDDDEPTTHIKEKGTRRRPSPQEEEYESECAADGTCPAWPRQPEGGPGAPNGDPNDDASKTTLRELPLKAWIVQRALYTLSIAGLHQRRQQADSPHSSSPFVLIDLIREYNRAVQECTSLQLKVISLSRRLATMLTFLKGRQGGYLQHEASSTSFVNLIQASFGSVVAIFAQPKVVKCVAELTGSSARGAEGNSAPQLPTSHERLIQLKKLSVGWKYNAQYSTSGSSPNPNHQQRVEWHLRVSHWSILHNLYNATLTPLIVNIETSDLHQRRGGTGLSLELLLEEGRRLSTTSVKARVANVASLQRSKKEDAPLHHLTSTSREGGPTVGGGGAATVLSTPKWPAWLGKFQVDYHHHLVMRLLESILRMCPSFLLQRYVEEVAPLLILIWYRRLHITGHARGGGVSTVVFEGSDGNAAAGQDMTPQDKKKLSALVLARSGGGGPLAVRSRGGEYFLPTQREAQLGKSLLHLIRAIYDETYNAQRKELRRQLFNEAQLAMIYLDTQRKKRDRRKSHLGTGKETAVVEEVDSTTSEDEDTGDNCVAGRPTPEGSLLQGKKPQPTAKPMVEVEGEASANKPNNTPLDLEELSDLEADDDMTTSTTLPAAANGVRSSSAAQQHRESKYAQMLDLYFRQVGMTQEHADFVTRHSSVQR